MTFRINSLSIQGFRAFVDPVAIDFDADAVLIYGNNGTGKTSIFDAIEWALYGDLARFQKVEESKEEPNYRNVLNDGKYSVVLTLRSAAQFISITRTMDKNKSRLSVLQTGKPLKGIRAQAEVDRLLPRHIFQSTVSLGQRELSSFINVLRPADRYQSISSILGLTNISDFRQSLQAQADTMRDNLKAAVREIDSLKKDIEGIRGAEAETMRRFSKILKRKGFADVGVGSISQVTSSALMSRSKSLIATRTRANSVENRLGVLRELEGRIGDFENEERELHDLQVELPLISQEVVQLSKKIGSMKMDLADAEKHLDIIHREQGKVKPEGSSDEEFLRLSIERLAGSWCPLCGQAIDLKATRKLLKGKLLKTESRARNLAQEREYHMKRTASIRRELENAETRHASAEREEHQIATRVNKLEKTRSDLFAESKRLIRRPFKRISQLRQRLTEAINEASSEASRIELRIGKLQNETRVLSAIREIEPSAKEAEALQSQVRNLEQQKANLEKARNYVRDVLSWAQQAEAEEIQETLNRYSKEYNRNYTEMDPHPYFKSLELTTRVRSGKSEFLVRAHGKDASINVRTGFSEAQSNCVALCIFLALSSARRDIGLDTIILDDPVQTMDDMNVVGLVDLLRRHLGYRQIIVATPNREFFRLLSGHLSRPGSSQVAYSILGYTKGGPLIQKTEPALPSAKMDLSTLLTT